MANLEEANRAREKYSSVLRSLGAHAIAVEELDGAGKRTFVVVAYFEALPNALPSGLELTEGQGKMHVQLVAREAPRFKFE